MTVQTDVWKEGLTELTVGELAMPSAPDGGVIYSEDYEHGTIAYLRFRLYSNAIAVNDCYTLPSMRKRGHGAALLGRIFEVADKREVPVVLVVGGNGPPNPTDEELEAWYVKHGFARHKKWGYGEWNVPLLIRPFKGSYDPELPAESA